MFMIINARVRISQAISSLIKTGPFFEQVSDNRSWIFYLWTIRASQLVRENNYWKRKSKMAREIKMIGVREACKLMCRCQTNMYGVQVMRLVFDWLRKEKHNRGKPRLNVTCDMIMKGVETIHGQRLREIVHFLKNESSLSSLRDFEIELPN